MKLATLAAVLLLAGCTVGPDYKPPEAKLPDDWAAPLPPGATKATDDVTLAQWWTAFGDPELDTLVAAAIAGNRDLAGAAARVREARALRESAGAGDRPQIDLNGNATRAKRSSNAFGVGTPGSTFNLYSLGFDAAW
jgi:outer membrane protein TolC